MYRVWDFLAVQWLGTCLAVRGTRAQSPVRDARGGWARRHSCCGPACAESPDCKRGGRHGETAAHGSWRGAPSAREEPPQLERSPPQLEKALTQQRRPRAAKKSELKNII